MSAARNSSPPISRRMRSWVASFGVLAMTVLLTGLVAPTAAAAEGGVSFSATVNGQSVATSSDAHPVQLYGTRLAQVRLRVDNHTSSPVRVSSVRLEGEVLALPLFSYDTDVALVIPARSTKTLVFPVSMGGLGSQATGLVVGTVTLLGPNGEKVASQGLVTNVHGSLQSVYGLFGLAVLVLTVSSLVLALVALSRHTLPQNRWLRGVRFLIPGFGVGLILTFTLAAVGIFTAGPGHWLPLLVVASAAGLALGYLTPAPNEEELDDYDDDVLLAQIVVVDEDPRDEVTAAPRRPPTAAPRRPPTAAPRRPPTAAPRRPPTAAPRRPPTASAPRLPTAVPPAPPTTRRRPVSLLPTARKRPLHQHLSRALKDRQN
ncbi:MAG: hypothetical protein ABSG81_14235 [Acidimicrobiales bacterium]